MVTNIYYGGRATRHPRSGRYDGYPDKNGDFTRTGEILHRKGTTSRAGIDDSITQAQARCIRLWQLTY